MCAGAVVELAALITIMATAGSVKSTVIHSYPDAWHGTLLHLTVDEIAAPIVISLWLWLAWANGRGRDVARLTFAAFFGLITLSMLGALAQDAAVYAPADLIAGAVEWSVALAAVVLLFSKPSSRYYQQGAAAVVRSAG